MKFKIDWVFVAFIFILAMSGVRGWFYASSGISNTDNFVGDFFVGFLAMFFGVGVIIQIIGKIQDKMPKGSFTTKQWIDKVDSLNLK